jgi:hypothetical protein
MCRRQFGVAVLGLAAIALLLGGAGFASADFQPVATYEFQNTLAADQSGVASLTAVNPLGTSGFQTATLYGHTRQVYHFDGNTTPSDQGGLSLNTTGLVPTDNYSVEMVFSFSSSSGWRRILDVQNRQSDNGFYVDPNSQLDVFPVIGAGNTFTANAYHDVVLTVSNGGTVTGYLDGSASFSTSTTVMNINNPSNLMEFFLDNVVGGGQGEWSPGNIGLVRLYDQILSASQVQTQATDPFAGPAATAVPEPASLTLLGIGALGLAGYGWRRRKAA